MDKIKYSIIAKNKKVVKIPKLYGRIRDGKRERLVPLGRNPEEAQKWLKRAQRAYEEACDLEAEGKPIPPELLARVLPVEKIPGAPACARRARTRMRPAHFQALGLDATIQKMRRPQGRLAAAGTQPPGGFAVLPEREVGG